jgi:hypothetical protein
VRLVVLGGYEALREQGVDQGLDVLVGNVTAGDVWDGRWPGGLQVLEHRAHADGDRFGSVQFPGELRSVTAR